MQTQEWTFDVLQEHDSLAFSVPANSIFVTQRLLGLLANDDQLAFILAHELAHQICRHGGEAISWCAPQRACAWLVHKQETQMLRLRCDWNLPNQWG